MATSKKATKKTAAKKKPIKVSAAQARKAMKGANVIQPPKKRAYKRKPKVAAPYTVEQIENSQNAVEIEAPAQQAEAAGPNPDYKEQADSHARLAEIYAAEQDALFENAEFITIDGLSTDARLAILSWLIGRGFKQISEEQKLIPIDNVNFINQLLDQRIGAIRNLGHGVISLHGVKNAELLASHRTVSLEGITVQTATQLVWVGAHVPAEIEINGAHYSRVG